MEMIRLEAVRVVITLRDSEKGKFDLNYITVNTRNLVTLT